MKERDAEIAKLKKQVVKTKELLREFLPAAITNDLKKRTAVFLTDEEGKS